MMEQTKRRAAAAAFASLLGAVAAGGFFSSGARAGDAYAWTQYVADGIEAQTHQVMDNLKRVLTGAGLSLDRVVTVRVFLTEFDRDYLTMNKIYESYFAKGKLPARTTVGVTALARGAIIEIDMIARR